MKVIAARNVSEALFKGISVIQTEGVPMESRAGNTLEVMEPVATVYERPWERVLISPDRDANHFFHFFEALWILAGRDDVQFLTEFNKRMAEYSDNGTSFNAPYGWRLRNGIAKEQDQIAEVIKVLAKDPNSRQAICQIWDDKDLTENTKDKACNMSVAFRMRNGRLTMTVYNRSNDMIWGAYGANAVQFSMLQEYIAMHLGVPMGSYTQVSNSFHVYTEGAGGDVWDRLCEGYNATVPYPQGFMCMGEHDHAMAIDADLKLFFALYDEFGLWEITHCSDKTFASSYFTRLVLPMLRTWKLHKTGGPELAYKFSDDIGAEDWREGVRSWLLARDK